MNQVKVELCVENYEAAKFAEKLGYDSVEINSALCLGGLTPSAGVVRKIAENINIKKNCMIRNRAAGFCYTDNQFRAMLEELDILLNEKIDGIVFGFLTFDFEIDKEKTKAFVEKIHDAGKIAIFHRAFDNTNNPFRSIENLIELNVDRVLTSGQTPSALDNMSLIKELIQKYDDKIEIILGSGINPDNAIDLIKTTNARYIHSSCKKNYEDITTKNNIDYTIFGNFGNTYIDIDVEIAEKLIKIVKSHNI
ncbi:copper homeostasis protein CutC [Helcococcus ovis]|uniref:Copper homeostasis protein cutC homolog n=1 Tax=Helcococcus ovis TaxID=72026 RepID=A0A4R9C2T5_9FIRM|nr:copper homeostasis protein CutC [Helcococcus ovis]TFF65171.1 copper homeostasis protein CutC [Helcococcus ovis]TFF66299.1 copper homeostasis protein CutC [Helcococcus ovis]